jgi:hypothetical protein
VLAEFSTRKPLKRFLDEGISLTRLKPGENERDDFEARRKTKKHQPDMVLAGLVLRSLWITIPEPDGKELHHSHAPKLFDVVSRVGKTLSGPKVHHLLISDEFNAGIVQIPRFGMFGWLRK